MSDAEVKELKKLSKHQVDMAWRKYKRKIIISETTKECDVKPILARRYAEYEAKYCFHHALLRKLRQTNNPKAR